MSWVGENERRRRRRCRLAAGSEHSLYTLHARRIHLARAKFILQPNVWKLSLCFRRLIAPLYYFTLGWFFSYVYIFYTWYRRNPDRRVSFMCVVYRRVYMILLPVYLLGRLVGGNGNLFIKYILYNAAADECEVCIRIYTYITCPAAAESLSSLAYLTTLYHFIPLDNYIYISSTCPLRSQRFLVVRRRKRRWKRIITSILCTHIYIF